MKKKIAAAALAVLFLFPLFTTPAFAGGGGEEPPEPPTETAVPDPKPFTPEGTGTVVDHASDGDGKEFYTIITADENVFYLIIDHQRDMENVYFLNVVTEQDLMALAGTTGKDGESAIPEPEQTPTPEPTPEPEPEPAPEALKNSNMGMMLVIALVVLVGGGAAYYFKIYRPKQEQSGMEDDYGEYIPDDYEPEGYENEDAPLPGDEDAPPWEDESELDIDGEDE